MAPVSVEQSLRYADHKFAEAEKALAGTSTGRREIGKGRTSYPVDQRAALDHQASLRDHVLGGQNRGNGKSQGADLKIPSYPDMHRLILRNQDYALIGGL